jgi:hypothetical protein
LSYLVLGDIYPNDDTGIIEQIAMTTKATVNNIADLSKRRPLKDYTTHKIASRIVLRGRPIDQKRWMFVLKGVYIEAVEVVDAIVSSCV